MSVQSDYYSHGGRPCAPRNQGKILVRCTTCKHGEFVYQSRLNRVTAGSCPACGWRTLEPSLSSRESAKKMIEHRKGAKKGRRRGRELHKHQNEG